jgi:uncharacterized membrane protein YdbT with pleckstrin-like domain
MTPAELERARDAWVLGLDRPHPRLLWLYVLRSLATGPLFPIACMVLYFKYHTLAYRFEAEGVRVSWGVLFHQETYLAYRKIQDIHVSRGFIERWFGLATVEVQTASGSTGAEISLEGLEDHEAVRDFLYRRMRGHDEEEPAEGAASTPEAAAGEADVVAALREVTGALEATRRALEAGRGTS